MKIIRKSLRRSLKTTNFFQNYLESKFWTVQKKFEAQADVVFLLNGKQLSEFKLTLLMNTTN